MEQARFCYFIVLANGLTSLMYGVKTLYLEISAETGGIKAGCYFLLVLLIALLVKKRGNAIGHKHMCFVLIAFSCANVINGNLFMVSAVVAVISLCYLLVEAITVNKTPQ